MNAIFPARMNPPHVGHFMTIRKQLCEYDFIYIYLHDDGDDFMSVEERKNIIETILEDLPIKVIIEHIGFQNRIDFSDIHKGVVLTGNPKVIDNCKKHCVLVKRINRYPDYVGTQIRESMRCNICKQRKDLYDATELPQHRMGLIPVPYTHICQQCYFKLLKEFLDKLKEV